MTSDATDRRSGFTGADASDERGAMTELDPITPAEAVEFYLDKRRPEVSTKTLNNQRYRLESFVEWCQEEAELENMNRLTGRDLHHFRNWRLDKGDISKVTLAGILQTLRVFLEFCASIDAVEPGLREKVLIPDVDPEDETRDELLDVDRAEAILDYLDTYQYASRDHVILAILWHGGIRLGSLRAFDLEDFDPERRCLRLRHRPETGTPLKNDEAAERVIAVGEHYCDVVRDYIAQNRDDVIDEHGRQPLITSTQGRLSETSIRETVYQLTRPCMITDCPHDRDPKTCEAMDYGHASECPSSRSPHGVRRGSITHHLREDTPREVVSERMNVSPEILDKHYDERTEYEKMETRRDYLEGV